MINNFIKSFFDGYKEARIKNGYYKERDFNELEGPFLFSSDHLNNLYNQADCEEDYESILDHLYRHDAIDVESYSLLEKKIIDKYWEG